jgi:hypothetical protein
MDGTRFDLWTRRRFGAAAGGVAASLLSFLTPASIAARKRKKKKKKRCTTLGVLCAGAPACCGDLRCDIIGGGTASQIKLCCKRQGSCRFNADCCVQRYCNAQKVCVACEQANAACTPSGGECCPELLCVDNLCVPPTSDRALKENFASVDPTDILQRVRELPITTWNYTADDPAVRHVGPMAQDFAALFAVGADDRHIHPLDGQGVALAAIQGLLAQIDELQADNARLAARVATLEQPEEPSIAPYHEAPAA